MYSLEPSLRDFYVEGRLDEAIVHWFVSHYGRRQVGVRRVDDIDIPAADVHALGFSSGTKGRALTLGATACNALDEESADCLFVVVDRDFDSDETVNLRPSCIGVTDFPSMESYLLFDESLQEFLDLQFPGLKLVASEVIQAISSTLHDLFSLRLAAHTMRLSVRITSWAKCLTCSEPLSLDVEELCRRSANASDLS